MKTIISLFFLTLVIYFNDCCYGQNISNKVDVESIITNLNIDDSIASNEILLSILNLDSLELFSMIKLWEKQYSWRKNLFISDIIIQKTKENLLNILASVNNVPLSEQTNKMVTLTLLKFRIFYYPSFNWIRNDSTKLRVENFKIIPNRDIFPICINSLDDSSNIEEGLLCHEAEEIRSLALTTIEVWYTNSDSKFNKIRLCSIKSKIKSGIFAA